MKASLELDDRTMSDRSPGPSLAPAAELPFEIATPIGGAVRTAAPAAPATRIATASHASPRPSSDDGLPRPAHRRMAADPSPSDAGPAAATIAAGLRAASASLLDRAGPMTEARFCDFVVRRLAALVEDSVGMFRRRVGIVAATLCGEQRMLVEDLALMLRPDSERLVDQAARVLSPSELLAILTAACEARSPGGLDALRCRDAISESGSILAREAVLDIVWSGLGDAPLAIIDETVAAALLGAMLSSRRLVDTTRRALTTAFASGAEAPETEAFDPSGFDDREALLLASISEGRSERAIDRFADAAGVTAPAVRDTIALQNIKGFVSLAWRAGFSADVASAIQQSLGAIPPARVIGPTAAGEFPLSDAEMQWHCEFLADRVTAALAHG